MKPLEGRFFAPPRLCASALILFLLVPSLLRAQAPDDDFPPSGEDSFYRVESVPLPAGSVMEVGGLAFDPAGALWVCNRRGEVWSARFNADGQPSWKLFASGLHEPLGIAPGNTTGEVFVVQRPEMTRLRDTDGDGSADRYETFSAAWGLTGNYHEFAFGPVRDKDGNLWGTLNVDFKDGSLGGSSVPYRGWVYKVTPKGEFVPWAAGMRSPNGVGISPDGDVFVADNQGDYVGTSPVIHAAEGDFLGHPAGLRWDTRFKGDPYALSSDALDAMRKRPALLLPYDSMSQSTAQPVWDTTSGAFGPFAGQMLIAEQRKCTIIRAALEKVGGEWQGAAFPFRAGFTSGVNRLAFAPDGSLVAGGTDRGWGSVGGRPFGLHRVVWTGKVPLEILTMSVTKEGFDLTFTKPLDAALAADASIYSLQNYHYHYHRTYGSPQVGQAAVPIQAVRISEDRRKVSLILSELAAGKIYELRIKGLAAKDGTALLHDAAYYTLNRRLDDPPGPRPPGPRAEGKPGY